MSRIYERRYQLQLGNSAEYLDIEMKGNVYNSGNALRISFLVQHEMGGYVSYAEISIYNMTRDHEDSIFDKWRSVTLQAGYESAFGVIFKGEIINVQRIPVGNSGTRGIKIFCMSSARAVSYNVVNKSFGSSATAKDILTACAQAINIPILFYGDFSYVPNKPRGTTLNGDPSALLDSFQKSLDFKWCIENNVIKIIRNGYQVEGDMFVFSADSGMIGSPVVTDVEISVRVALNPVVQLGRKIKIESVAPEFAFSGAYTNPVPRSIGEGVYQVTRIVHVGDSHGQEWQTQLSSLRLDASDRDTLAARISQ